MLQRQEKTAKMQAKKTENAEPPDGSNSLSHRVLVETCLKSPKHDVKGILDPRELPGLKHDCDLPVHGRCGRSAGRKNRKLGRVALSGLNLSGQFKGVFSREEESLNSLECLENARTLLCVGVLENLQDRWVKIL